MRNNFNNTRIVLFIVIILFISLLNISLICSADPSIPRPPAVSPIPPDDGDGDGGEEEPPAPGDGDGGEEEPPAPGDGDDIEEEDENNGDTNPPSGNGNGDGDGDSEPNPPTEDEEPEEDTENNENEEEPLEDIYSKNSKETDNVTIILTINGMLCILFDSDDDGEIDSFKNMETGIETKLLKTDNGEYKIDINDNGDWEYIYNPLNGKTAIIEKKASFQAADLGTSDSNIKFLYLFIIISTCIIVTVLTYWIYHDQKKLSINKK